MKYKTTISLLAVLAALVANAFTSQKTPPQKTPTQKIPVETQAVKDSLRRVAVADSLKLEESKKYKLFKKSAHASYYADKFTGRRTASGKIFDNKKYTAAHRKLPFGTKLRITSEATGKSVVVTVTDRGPFTKGKDIDLTKKAFMEIAPKNYGGYINVTIETIQ